MHRLLFVSVAVSVVSFAVGAAAAFGAVPPRLPNLTGYFRGEQPKRSFVVSNGIRFACFTFVGRDGVLSECFAVSRVAAKVKPKPSGPVA